MGWSIEQLSFIDYHCCCYWHVFIYGYKLLMVLNILFHVIRVMSLYALGWCICQDKPYGTIILTTISFRAYNENYQLLWIFISFYILTLTKLLSKHRSMFWNFGCFGIVKIIFFREFCMLYHLWLSSCHLRLYRTYFVLWY